MAHQRELKCQNTVLHSKVLDAHTFSESNSCITIHGTINMGLPAPEHDTAAVLE